jgi:hypothetical protein
VDQELGELLDPVDGDTGALLDGERVVGASSSMRGLAPTGCVCTCVFRWRVVIGYTGSFGMRARLLVRESSVIMDFVGSSGSVLHDRGKSRYRGVHDSSVIMRNGATQRSMFMIAESSCPPGGGRDVPTSRGDRTRPRPPFGTTSEGRRLIG